MTKRVTRSSDDKALFPNDDDVDIVPSTSKRVKDEEDARIIPVQPMKVPSSLSTLPSSQDRDLIGCRVAKYFIPEHSQKTELLYYGRVVDYEKEDNDAQEESWTVEYNDGDKEELTFYDELIYMKNEGNPKQLNKIGLEFVHFLHYRQIVWMHRHPKQALAETHYNQVPDYHKPLSNKLEWKLLQCAKFGNSYRHLDSATQRLGRFYIPKKLGLLGVNPTRWDKVQIEGAFVFCSMQMAGFLPSVIRTIFPKWDALEEECCFPSSTQELLHLSKNLVKLPRPVFSDQHQTQGMRWVNYLRKWTKPGVLASAIQGARNAQTWKQATLELQKLPGVGPYSAAQAMCDVFLGVFQKGEGLFLYHKQIVATMKDGTGWGPGPKSSLNNIFPGVDTDNALVMLVHAIDRGFQNEGLDFPYLLDPITRERQMLNCVDLEHALCYFHRYLNAKKRLGAAKINKLHEVMEDGEFLKNGILPPIKKLEMIDNVDALCGRLLLDE